MHSRVIFEIYESIKFIVKNNDNVIDHNEKALMEPKKISKGNIYVNVVSEKSLNSTNFSKDKVASRLIKFLEKNGISFSWCDIPKNGYHAIDNHPSAEGYEKLRVCTEDALKKIEKAAPWITLKIRIISN